MIVSIISLILTLLWSPAFAATYYVSPTGSNENSGEIDSPWLTPEYGASHTATGDTLLIRAGTYNVTTYSTSMKASIAPSANNVTIKAYPGESVTLIGNGGVAPTNGVIGSFDGTTSRSGTVIDGFTIQGLVVMMGTGTTLKNCDVSVGGDSWSGINQGDVVWLHSCTDCFIQNNKLHDNTLRSTPGNSPVIITYDSTRATIENNELYNSAGTGFTNKDHQDHHIFRYNYVHDNTYAGIHTGMQDPMLGTQIYQNIIANNNKINDPEMGGIVTLNAASQEMLIYNNTFYNNKQGDLVQWVGADTTTFEFFNNISANPVLYHISAPYGSSTFSGMTYCNYNAYYNDVAWKYQSTINMTLSGWQSTCQGFLAGCDTNAVTTDPGFINASGTFSTPSDFKRASYPTNGRGGSYPSVMGAYITGNEVIGASLDYTPASCDSSHLNLCTTQTPCLAAGGYWWSDSTCHSSQEVIAGSSSIRSINGELRKVNGHLIGISQ